MIKTLRITSIIAAILAAVFFILALVFGIASQPEYTQFLNTDSLPEQFKRAQADKMGRSDTQIPPLVKQAQAFALYLNPPKPKPTPAPIELTKPRPSAVSPKFKLIGTSVHQSRPELSMALIDEPGKGLHWVRQASQVGHLVIEQVKDGYIVVRDGQKTFDIKVIGRQERTTLVKKSSSSKAGTSREVSTTGEITTSDLSTQVSPEEQLQAIKQTIAELKEMEAQIRSDKATPQENIEQDLAIIRGFIKDLEAEATRISDEEAKKLDHLGKELSNKPITVLSDHLHEAGKDSEEPKDVNEDPNQKD